MSGTSQKHVSARERVGIVLKDKWHLDALLGMGGTAAVYSASHRNGKRAAIKILHQELSANTDLVGRFLREGYVANKLEHPGAVSVLDDDRTADGSVFLVMELLDGYSLDRHTRPEAERLALGQVIRIGDEVLDVLASAHTKGVIHRDIKPANLFLCRDGRVKVLDFGIARLREGREGDPEVSATQTGQSIGTPAFMPPEQARGRWSSVDARTDIWAVGATLFALLSGQRPRRAETVNEELLLAMVAPMPKIQTLAPHVPPAIAQVVDCALAFEMNDRFPDARAMQRALRQASSEIFRNTSEPAGAINVQQDTAPGLHGGEMPDRTVRQESSAVQRASSNPSPFASPFASTQGSSSSQLPRVSPHVAVPVSANASPFALTTAAMTEAVPVAVPRASPYASTAQASHDMTPIDMLDARYTTARPILTDTGSPAMRAQSSSSSSGLKVAVVGFLALGIVVCVGGLGFLRLHKGANAGAPQAPVAPSAIATESSAPTASTSLAATTGTIDPSTTTSGSSTAFVIMDKPAASATPANHGKSATKPAAASNTSTSTSTQTETPAQPHATPSARPAAGTPSAGGNPWDQRF